MPKELQGLPVLRVLWVLVGLQGWERRSKPSVSRDLRVELVQRDRALVAILARGAPDPRAAWEPQVPQAVSRASGRSGTVPQAVPWVCRGHLGVLVEAGLQCLKLACSRSSPATPTIPTPPLALGHDSGTGLRDGVVVVRFARCRVFVLCPIRRQHW